MKAIAITDHGVMYGVIDFYKACKKEGIKPIIGCEVYVAPRSRFDKDGAIDKEYNHLILLAKNNQGYKNLIAENPDKFEVIDAGGTAEQTQSLLRQALVKRGVFK